MNVGVDKLVNSYLTKVDDRFHQDYYFVDNCSKENKFSLRTNIKDLSLQIFFEKNNFIEIGCKISPYCIQENVNRKIKLINNKTDNEEFTIVNNYLTKIVDDTWDKIEW